MGRYDPLRDYLAECATDELTLSFEEIEGILGFALPPSARRYDAWWSNIEEGAFASHSQARSWHAAGFRVRVNRAAGQALFCRISSAAAIPFMDWNADGRLDPVDIGVSMAAVAPRSAEAHAFDLREKWRASDGRRIALISCSKQKKTYPCRAAELYSASTLFSLSYEYAARNADEIYILSAKHGLVGENEIIEPYNETLNDKPMEERRAWAGMVLEQLADGCDIERDSFLILAGKNYYEFLLPRLPKASLPLGNLPRGRRIEFLRRSLSPDEGEMDAAVSAARIHQLLNELPLYDWQTIDAIPFQDGVYVVYEQGERYRQYDRIVRVGTHTSPGRLKRRLMDHFLKENHNGSIFRKNIGKAMLNREGDPYLSVWSLDTSKPPNIGKADGEKEAEIEGRVSAYMRQKLTFRVFPVDTREERLRLEEAIIATLNRADDFAPSENWLGNESPERMIRESGLWLKQGLDAQPLTKIETDRLSQLISTAKIWEDADARRRRAESPACEYKAGDRIRHTAFGSGIVLSVTRISGDALVEIDFGERGIRKLMLGAARKCLSRNE